MPRHLFLGTFCALCLVAVALPGPLGIGQRTGPLILGLPPSLSWTVLWVALSFAAILTYYLTGRRG